jgi:hypothetical protein
MPRSSGRKKKKKRERREKNLSYSEKHLAAKIRIKIGNLKIIKSMLSK